MYLKRGLALSLFLGFVFLLHLVNPTSANIRFDQPVSFQTSEPTIVLQKFASGFTDPLYVTHAGDDRLFVVELGGKIKIIQKGQVLARPFLDISSLVERNNAQTGLLGLAFEPDFLNTRRFYVYYIEKDTFDSVVARYYVTNDLNVADSYSRVELLRMPQDPRAAHYGGWMGFNPTGSEPYLHIAFGDGGDPSMTNYDNFCYAQNLSDWHGKILRIDVTQQYTYTAPTANQFAKDQAPEVFVYGFRNPWRASFDHLTGDLYIGDVGEFAWEEVDIVPNGNITGMNFGWSMYEGNELFGELKTGETLHCEYDTNISPTVPSLVYAHEDSQCAIIGGYVYRGKALPSLYGKYTYGDLCTGQIWSATNTATGALTATSVLTVPDYLSSFGEDKNGELYLVGISSGTIYRLAAPKVEVNTYIQGIFLDVGNLPTITPTPTATPTSSKTATPISPKNNFRHSPPMR